MNKDNLKEKETGTLKKPIGITVGDSNLKGEVTNVETRRVLKAVVPGTSGSRGPAVVKGSSDRKGQATFTVGSSVNAALAPMPETGAKVIPEAKRRYRNRRAARRILDRLAATPEGLLTHEQRESLAWAKVTFLGNNSGRVPAESKRRQRSQDEVEAGESKRPRMQGAQGDAGTHGARLFSDVLKEHPGILAVIDRSQEDGSITLDKWRLVYNALNSVFLTVLGENPGPPPSCRDAGWHQGRVKLTACADQRSADLYRLAVARVGGVWRGAKLAVVGRDEIPSRPRARVWLPIEPSCPDEIMRIIRASNVDLPTDNWKIVKQEEAKGGSRLSILVVNKESLAPLAKTKGVIDFGFGSITLKVFKKDEAEAMAEDLPGKEQGEGGGTQDVGSSVMERLTAMGSRLSLDSNEEDRVESMEEEGGIKIQHLAPEGSVRSDDVPLGPGD